MNWYFIRHGQIASNLKKVYSGRSEEELTEAGRGQVKQASHELADIKIDAIFSSPLKRTRQSADIIVKELKWDLPVHSDESFIELGMGPWEGLAETEVERRYPKEWALWNKSPADLVLEGRETLQDLHNRIFAGISNITESGRYQSVLVVTHVAVIRVVSLWAAKKGLNQYKQIPVENAAVFKFVDL